MVIIITVGFSTELCLELEKPEEEEGDEIKEDMMLDDSLEHYIYFLLILMVVERTNFSNCQQGWQAHNKQTNQSIFSGAAFTQTFETQKSTPSHSRPPF